MKYIFKLIIAICIVHNLNGQVKNQSKLDLMQGIWENIMSSDEEKAFTIINGKYSIDYVFSNDSLELDFPLGESVEGFQDYDNGNYDSINVNYLKGDGLYYTVIDKKELDAGGWVHRPNYLTPNYFECDGALMSINGGKLVEYEKINKLPKIAVKRLYYRGKQDKRDYLKDYLNIIVIEITASKSMLYSEQGKSMNIQLSKGDVVTVLKERGSRIQVDYGTDTPGWIEKKDTK